MTDPDRLFEASNDETARLLLKAGRAGAPLGARERAVVVASSVIAGSSLAAGSAAAGGATLAAKVGSVAAFAGIKGLAVVGVACVATVAAGVAIQKSGQKAAVTARTPVRTTLAAPAVPVSISLPVLPRESPSSVGFDPPVAPSMVAAPGLPAHAEPSAAAEPPSLATPLVASSVVRVSKPASAATDSPAFTDELAMLDSARHAIDAADPARALSILDGYARRFAGGTMRQEASILRIEALEKAGDPFAAKRAAEAFLHENPTTPYAARVRSLVGSPNP
jgi:hypothetical protein